MPTIELTRCLAGEHTDRETGLNGQDIGFYAPGYCACAPLYSSDGDGDDFLIEGTQYEDDVAKTFTSVGYALNDLKRSMFGSNYRVLFSNGMSWAGTGDIKWSSEGGDYDGGTKTTTATPHSAGGSFRSDAWDKEIGVTGGYTFDEIFV